MPQVFLLTGATSFADPGNWDPVNNKVECLGSGYRGGNAFVPVTQRETRAIRRAGAGGGAGSYAWATNLAPTFPVALNVAAKNQFGINSSPNNATTWWRSISLTAGTVLAYCGSGPNMTAGGPGGIAGYPNGAAGGNGGNSSAFADGAHGSGGGGSGGPHGAGSSGAGSAPFGPEGGGSFTTGTGGYADVNNPPGGQNVGSPGGSGTQWDATHGCGSGGAGGSNTAGYPGGGAGGAYGGGGGGQGGDSTAPAFGDGANGLMIITWTALPPRLAQIIVMV